MLVVLGVWRYVYKKFPLRYDPLYWGGGLPVRHVHSLYTADGRGDGVALSICSPTIFIYLALAVWMATFVGLAYRLLRRLFVASSWQRTS